MKSEEARLLRRLQNGEAEAFAALLDRDGARVRALALRMGVSPGDADDVTQEIWLAVFKSVGSFRGEAGLSTWVYRVAINCCLKWRQKERGRPDQNESDELELLPSTDERSLAPRELERRELGQHVRAAIEGLSDAHRAVVVLHEMHGLSYAQCAQVLQVPVGTVKSRLFNAFGRLRTHLGPYVLEEDEAGEPSAPRPSAPRPKTSQHPLEAQPKALPTQTQPCAGESP